MPKKSKIQISYQKKRRKLVFCNQVTWQEKTVLYQDFYSDNDARNI